MLLPKYNHLVRSLTRVAVVVVVVGGSLLASSSCGALAYSVLSVGGTTTTTSTRATNTPGDRRSFLARTALVAVTTATSTTVATPSLVMAVDSDEAPPADNAKFADFITTESGLRYKVLQEGTGAIPNIGQTVKAHYTGWLDGFDSGGRKFDSSRDKGRPFTFAVGRGQVIRGWDETFSNMSIGERRQIIIPPRLGYGDRGAGGIIPPGATLYFDVELLNIV